MSNFIRSIGGCYVANIGFDLYENKNGSATVRPIKLGHDFPKTKWLKFKDLAAAEAAIDSISPGLTGAQRVAALQQAWLD
jgi:hypothetical protein